MNKERFVVFILVIFVWPVSLGFALDLSTRLAGQFYDFKTNTIVASQASGVPLYEKFPSDVKGLLPYQQYNLDVEVSDSKGRLREVEIVEIYTGQFVTILRPPRDGTNFKLRKKGVIIVKLNEPVVLAVNGLPVKAERVTYRPRTGADYLKGWGINEKTWLIKFGLEPTYSHWELDTETLKRAPEHRPLFEIDVTDALADKATIKFKRYDAFIADETTKKDLERFARYFHFPILCERFIKDVLPAVPIYESPSKEGYLSWQLSQDKAKNIIFASTVREVYATANESKYTLKVGWADPVDPFEVTIQTDMGFYAYRSYVIANVRAR